MMRGAEGIRSRSDFEDTDTSKKKNWQYMSNLLREYTYQKNENETNQNEVIRQTPFLVHRHP
jgi:hypothetical protein